jgi:hypothetical protein
MSIHQDYLRRFQRKSPGGNQISADQEGKPPRVGAEGGGDQVSVPHCEIPSFIICGNLRYLRTISFGDPPQKRVCPQMAQMVTDE